MNEASRRHEDPGLEARLRFEEYLSDVATRFLRLPADEVEDHLGPALHGLLDALDVDRCGMALFDEDTRGLPVAHNFSRPGIPPHPLVDVAPLMPWYTQQVREGRTLVFPRVPEDVPPEGRAEAENAARSGVKSHVAVPMRAGGQIQGAVSFATFTAHRDWDPELVPRLELFAGVLANALYRRRAEGRLRQARELSESILASLPHEIAVVDVESRVLALNQAWARGEVGAGFPRVAVGDDLRASLEGAVGHGSHEGPDDLGLCSVLSGEATRVEGLRRHPGASGSRAYLFSTTPLQGAARGAVVVHTDVTELEETKAALERSLLEVEALKERLEAENVVLQQQVRDAQGFEALVGTSPALHRALAQVEQVAPTDAPVLLLGETGTGKGLVARAIHDRSRRRERTLVTVNCAALPATLVESEVFGFEKGAFTGATQRTLGRFEVAHGGTLFLDEIGDLPLEAQAKLLRVLQTGELERLGSSKTMKVDVRLVAATNRDLGAEVRAGRFRADLYYRLRVFPITLPPLRHRPEDIPLLVWHFITSRQARLGRSVKRVPEKVMRSFAAYSWPGNVRELENVVERSLIMTSGSTLAADPSFPEATPALSAGVVGADATLADMEREHIRAVLDCCGWRIAGRGNAAERLGLNRSTLQSRMKKLGIRRPSPPPGARRTAR